MDIFTWSVPFVAEKVVEMLLNVLNQGKDLPDDQEKITVNLSGSQKISAIFKKDTGKRSKRSIPETASAE